MYGMISRISTGCLAKIFCACLVVATVLTCGAGLAKADDFIPTITTVAGNRDLKARVYTDGIPATEYSFRGASGIQLDKEGNIYIISPGEFYQSYKIKKVNATDGIISTLAGNGHPGPASIGAKATSSRLYYPNDLDFTTDGTPILADRKSFIRIDENGYLQDYAYLGYPMGYGFGYAHKLYEVDSEGNIYVCLMIPGTKIFKLNVSDGSLTHIAGNGTSEFNGDNIDARLAGLGIPYNEFVLDEERNCLYISEYTNHRVRRIDLGTGMIATYAGTGDRHTSVPVDGIPAAQSDVFRPKGLAVDDDGNLYICDFGQYRVRKVEVEEPHIISTVAGGNGPGSYPSFEFLDDDIPANRAFIAPGDVEVDNDGNLLILCEGGGPESWFSAVRVRKVFLKPAIPNCPEGVDLVHEYIYDTHSVNICWSAPSEGATPAGYKVYRDGAVVCDVPHYHGKTGYDCDETGLTDCTEYCYTVVAYNSSGKESEECATACVSTSDETAPSVPANVNADALSGSEIVLTWDASTDNCETMASNYYIYDCSGVYVGSTDTTTYIAGGLDDCTQYCFRVSAVDSTGNESAPGGPATAWTLDVTPPDCPDGFTAVAVSGTEIALNWAVAADECDGFAAGYTIILPDGSYVNTTDTSFMVTGLEECSLYCFSIASYDSSGNSSGVCSQACAKTPWVIDSGSDPKHCGGVHNLGSTVPAKFTITDEGAGLGPDEIGTLMPKLYKVGQDGSLTPVDITVVGSQDGMFKYQGGGVWMVNVKTTSLAPGEYVLSAEPVPNEGSGCSYIVLDPAPYCGFTLVEPGGRGKGK